MCEPNNFYLIFWFGLTEKALFQVNFGFAVSECRLRERGRMSKPSVYVRVFRDLKLLRYVLRCAIGRLL